MGVATLIFGILGNIVASVFFASPVLTFWRIVRKRAVEDFSGLPYVCSFATTSIWTFYGLPFVIEHGLLVVTINAAGAALNLIFILLFLIFSAGTERRKVAVLFSAVVVLLGLLILVNLAAVPKHERRKKVVGSIALVVNIFMYAAPLSNTKLVIQTRSVEYLPFFFTFMAFVNATVWSTYSVLTSDIFIMIPNVIGVALGFSNLLLYAIYYNAKPKLCVDDLEAEKNHEVAVAPPTAAETKPKRYVDDLEVEKSHEAAVAAAAAAKTKPTLTADANLLCLATS